MNNAIDGVAQQLPKYTVKDLDSSLRPVHLQQNLRNIISDLEKVLNDPIIKYDITFSKKSYKFKEPIDDEERDFIGKERQQLIKAMLKKAINKFIDNYYKYQDDEDYNDTSFDLIQYIISMHATDLAISVPVGEEYEIDPEELDRSLELQRDEKDKLVVKRPKPCKCYRFEDADIKIECDGKCIDK